jgi:glycogen(starch) synthase
MPAGISPDAAAVQRSASRPPTERRRGRSRTTRSRPAAAQAAESTPTEQTSSNGRSRPRRAEPLLLEIAWEAVNQVGGIYTVLRSKAPVMSARWGSRYCLVGPYEHASAQVEFEPTPLVGAVGQAVKALREQGVGCEFGRWLVTGRPHVVLLHTDSLADRLGELKYLLWGDHGIPSHDDPLFDRVVLFGEAVRMLLETLAGREAGRRQIIAHLHEWMAGSAIPSLRKNDWPGSLVFTTHATLLGRYLAMHHPVFYDHLPYFNADAEAKHFNIQPQHGIEKAAAHGSHVFTTVSDVTGSECTHLLGRSPDVLLPNGLNIQRFSAMHEFQNLHQQYKERIHQFTMGHFFPSYSFDLKQTLYMFTSGRYEFKNKGMDLTIESLARLNYRLKQAQTPVTVVFFLITRAPVKNVNVQVLESAAALADFREMADAIKQQVGDRLFEASASGRIPDLNELVDDYWRLRLRRAIQAWRRDRPPQIVTHDLQDDQTDSVLQELRRCSLFNREQDPVKVVFHPDFISPTSPLFGLEYEQFVRGTHLGVFPSYYEPWGYTPLESIALGVPAATSDLSGFGSYLQQLLPDHDQRGVYVVGRRGRSFHDAAEDLTDVLLRFCQLSRRERIQLRNSVESFSEHFDWHVQARRYHEAHELALDRTT